MKKSQLIQVQETKKGRGRIKITLVEVVTKDLSIKVVKESMVWIRQNGGKENMWLTLISLLRIHSRPQNFGSKACWSLSCGVVHIYIYIYVTRVLNIYLYIYVIRVLNIYLFIYRKSFFEKFWFLQFGGSPRSFSVTLPSFSCLCVQLFLFLAELHCT